MLATNEEFSNSLFNYCRSSDINSNNSGSMALNKHRFRLIQERCRQSCSKRGHGHYTQCPGESVFNDLISSLLVSNINVNAGLKLPTLSPDWLMLELA